MSNTDPFDIEFPPVRPQNLLRLGEDLLRAFSISTKNNYLAAATVQDSQCLLTISDIMTKDRVSPMGLSLAEVAALVEPFRKAVPVLSSLPRNYPTFDLWLRLYAHALLRETRIFPGVGLSDKSPDYSRNGFADIWKGNYRGQPVCIKVIRSRARIPLMNIEKTYRRINQEGKLDPHPNILPVIDVSDTLFPLCIMNPWMPDGNIIQYTQTKPGANRLVLLAQVCRGLMYLHGLDIIHGNITPNNILVTGHGQACLGEFGITGSFPRFRTRVYELANLRYMAPECFSLGLEGLGTKESDVYCLAMTSFSVLTGILPYDSRSPSEIYEAIAGGVRPSRQTNPSRNQWLQDPVWNVITTSWRRVPGRRCKLPAMYNVFLTSSQQEVDTAIEIGRQQRGKIIPRITSLFQFLRDSGSEIQRRRLEDHTMLDRERPKLFDKLCKMCNQHRVIPESMNIPDFSEDTVEVERGELANVSQSTYKGRHVALKVVHVYTTNDLDVILDRLCCEGVAWKHLRHPNILPLLGITVSERRFTLVSEWMEYGNINDFVETDQKLNRTELLVDVANGLEYVHDLRMVHGDLKGANILIDRHRRACIADFGLSTITGIATASGASYRASLISNDTLTSLTCGGTRRWMSPELLDPDRFGVPESGDNRPTRKSDCYALGMVIYEVLCGHHPFLEIPSDILVDQAIMEGVRPRKPEVAQQLGFSDELWETVELCWQEDRNARPEVEDIPPRLTRAAWFWHTREF